MVATTKDSIDKRRGTRYGSIPSLMSQGPDSSSIFFCKAQSELAERGTPVVANNRWLVSLVRSITAASKLNARLELDDSSPRSVSSSLPPPSLNVGSQGHRSPPPSEVQQGELALNLSLPSSAAELAVFPGDAAAILISLNSGAGPVCC